MAQSRPVFFSSLEDTHTNFLLAIQHGKFEEVNEKLVMKKIDVNFFAEGYSPLHIAARYGQVKICALLVDHGADINAVDRKADSGFLVLASASDMKNEKDEKTQEKAVGETPLALAVAHGYLDAAKLLLSKGANVNIKDIYGASPLYRAIVTSYFTEKNKIEMITLLLKYHSDMQISGDIGNETVLHVAINKHQFEIVKLLIEYHADINAMDKYQNTPLHIAIQHKDIEITRYLLEKGANGNIKNKQGKAPLELTEYQSYDDLLYYGFTREYMCRLV